jgi:hypothetical protein
MTSPGRPECYEPSPVTKPLSVGHMGPTGLPIINFCSVTLQAVARSGKCRQGTQWEAKRRHTITCLRSRAERIGGVVILFCYHTRQSTRCRETFPHDESFLNCGTFHTSIHNIRAESCHDTARGTSCSVGHQGVRCLSVHPTKL